MDDLDMLARDFGFGSRGKLNPMRSNLADHSHPASRSSVDDPLFGDVFGAPPKYSSNSNVSVNSNKKKSSMGDFDHDSIFNQSEQNQDYNSNSETSSLPVYDKPVYDDDIFVGLPGLKSKSPSSTAKLDDDDVFASISSPPSSKNINQYDEFTDLLGNLGRNKKFVESNKSDNAKSSLGPQGFDDLLGGFSGGSSATSSKQKPDSVWGSPPIADSKHSSSVIDDPFVVLESTSTTGGSASSKLYTDQVEDMRKLGKSRSARSGASFGGGGTVAFDNLDPLTKFTNPLRSFPPERDDGGKDGGPATFSSHSSGTAREQNDGGSFRYSENNMEKRVNIDKFQEPPLFDSKDFQKSFGQTASSPVYDGIGSQVDVNHASGQGQQNEEIWLTVSEVPLFTQPTSAPPPSRPPPPLPIPKRTSKFEAGSLSSHSRKKGDDFFPPSSYNQHSQNLNFTQPGAKDSPSSQFDELDSFAKGFSHCSFDASGNQHSNEESNAASAAAAMKEAMDKAEAKFRQAKEVREREHAKSVKNKETIQFEKNEQNGLETEFMGNKQDRSEHERLRREEEERAQMRLEREKERARELEREKARQAVDRANREARERAAAEARERAASDARLKMERAAVQRVQAEARERAAVEARERAQKTAIEAREMAIAAEAKERAEKTAAEARERAAAAEAKERADKAASEARERVAAEAKEKEAAEARRRSERAAYERAAAEARERASADARAKMAAAAKVNQQRYDNDLDSFFGMGRASSAPKARANSTDPFSSQQFPNKDASDVAKKTPTASGVSSNMKKASSATNIVDDLSSIFGAGPSSGGFHEVEGETVERRKARFDREQRTQERAVKALAEMNQRDIKAQRDQEERHRIADTLDIEIKRWAAGKEGNLRALLSTLQYVLWPECGWQPVSLTDLIMASSVKKVYRKATLCIHPDKVQQKGATLQQKYISEKVFDLLKEAWNKFNSEEFF